MKLSGGLIFSKNEKKSKNEKGKKDEKKRRKSLVRKLRVKGENGGLVEGWRNK